MSPDRLRLAIAVAAGLILAGAVFAISRGAPVWSAAVFGALVLFGVVAERWRYKRLERSAPPGFEPTAERFRDPISGAETTVYVNRATGERRYVKG